MDVRQAADTSADWVIIVDWYLMLLTAFCFPDKTVPRPAIAGRRDYAWASFLRLLAPGNKAGTHSEDEDMTEVADNESPEPSVLQRMADGDRGAVKDCIDRYGKLVWSVVCRFCPVPGDREDAVQEIFLEVWRSAGRYRTKIASEGTFITMIARRRMIDRLRKHKRQPALSDIDDVADSVTEIPAGGEDNAELVNVTRALSVLTPDQQTVIRLSVVHGYSHGEIAEKTGIPVGTVKTHIRRGLMRVRDQLSMGLAAESGVAYD